MRTRLTMVSALRSSAAILALLSCLAAAAACPAADPPKPAADKEPFNEPADCMGCHTYPLGNYVGQGSLNFVLLTEYATWKTQDKHAQAFAVLTGPRGQKMSEGLKKAGLPWKVAEDVAAGCLNCHAMHNTLTQDGHPYSREEGVSCAGCHGPSSGWRGDHTKPAWREKTPAQKEEKGMYDVRDPARRARLCLSCHVGSAADGKVVTHAMFAVGHPPLPPIEVALFSKNLPQHWRDSKYVPYLKSSNDKVREDYHLQTVDFQNTRQALVGSVLAFGATMRLVADRGNTQTKLTAGSVWPELLAGPAPGEPLALDKANAADATKVWPAVAMSHSDCYACHHELALPSWRQQRGYGLKLADGSRLRTLPGRPLIRSWPMALLGPAIRHAARAKPEAAKRTAYEKEQADGLRGQLEQLARALDDQPFGDPATVTPIASNLVKWSDGLAKDLAKAPYDRAAVIALLADLSSADTAGAADYEAARLIASAVQVVYGDLFPEKDKGDKDVRVALAAFNRSLDLEPYHGRAKRQRVVDEMVLGLLGANTAKGMKDFTDALANPGNEKLQEQQSENPILMALFNFKNGNAELTKRLRAPEVIDKLQGISDEELGDFLGAVNGYGPREFVKDLKTVRDHLPARPAN